MSALPTANIERLTAQFYQWEKRGRGWCVFDEPVDLEPAFTPFYYHSVPAQHVDDGVRPGILTGLSKLFAPKAELPRSEPEYMPDAMAYTPNGALHIFSVLLPKERKVTIAEAEQLLLMLAACKGYVSFEIIATESAITIQFACREPDDFHVKSQLKAYFPDCMVQEKDESDDTIFSDDQPVYILDLGLKEEFMRPLALAESFTVDPLTGLFGLMENLEADEQGAIQILFKGAVDPWAESILAAVTDGQGDSFFLDAPEMPKMAEEKISSPLFGVAIRVIGQGRSGQRAHAIAENLGKTLIRTTQSQGNSLIFLSNQNYPPDLHIEDVFLRQTHRLGMLLNSQELVNLVHLPSDSIVSGKIEREYKKTKAAPSITVNNQLVLGINSHQGVKRVVRVNTEQRLRHTHIIGATGTGKSTLLLNLIIQDIQTGKGIAVMDPHGDLIESILSHIPQNRIEDVIVLDPADAAYPVGFNILSAHSEIEKDILSSDLVSVFRRLSTSWGDQMNSVLANAILAFLESTNVGTLIDLRRFLIEPTFRNTYLKSVSDPSILYYWQKEYPLLRSTSIGPILTRLDTFLRPKLIRNMVAQKKGLDFEGILDKQKILLVKLSQGLIGSENSYLLGTIVVSKIYQAAMARQAQGKDTRSDYFLYIDEFQNFITPSMAAILSGARKYHLGLILAHQDMQQLMKQDSELANAVVTNAGTRICFRIGDTDAKRFEEGFSFFAASDLQNLHKGEAIARIDRPENDFNLSISLLADDMSDESIRQAILTKSRKKYGTPKEEVEASLGQMLQMQEVEIKPEVHEVVNKLVEEIKGVEIKRKEPVKIEIQKAIVSDASNDTLAQRKEISQHRYLQTLVKRMAESRGYKAVIEEPTPDGNGRVDVSLERNGKKIACEIGLSTTKEWELHNIEKCLAAGYELVVAIAPDRKALDTMQQMINEKLDKLLQPKVLVMELDAFFMLLDKEVAKEVGTDKRVKGYRVKVVYNPVSEDDMKRKRESVAKVVLDSLKKIKK